MTADLPRYLDRPVAIPEKNKSRSPDYREVYDAKTRALVAELHAEDIEYFGFTFDGGPTRNYWSAA